MHPILKNILAVVAGLIIGGIVNMSIINVSASIIPPPEGAENFDIIAWQPDVLVHCGALTHLDFCEEHVNESYQKTVQSTIHIMFDKLRKYFIKSVLSSANTDRHLRYLNHNV